MNTSRQPSLFGAARAAWANLSDPESIRPVARVFWYVHLSAVATAIIAIVAWSGFFFVDTMTAVASQETGPARRSQRVDRTQFDQVITQLTARQEAFAAHKLPVTAPPDPSL